MTRLLSRRMRFALPGLLALAMLAFGSLPANAAAADKENLVSNQPGVAMHVDAHLVNAWGISHSSSSPFWVSDNGTGVTTLYDTNGNPIPLVVTIPPPNGSPQGTTSAPTGQLFNPTTGFPVSSGQNTGPSRFIFVTEDGTISGWNPNVNQTNAILTVDKSESGAVYKGVTLGSTGQGTFLYAANFHAGTVDVFDSAWNPVMMGGSFTDPQLPAGFAPFNIANIGGNLFVAYALQDADKHDDVAGTGNGFVDVFNTQGVLLKRLISHTGLNSPWALTLAPAQFGNFSNQLLVGNFGSGRIAAFNPSSGAFLGYLTGLGRQDVPLTIPGLWGLIVGNGGNGGNANSVYFSAGPNHESDGLFGSLTTG
jgi:uncharacterized protein (TIGR03118 family)